MKRLNIIIVGAIFCFGCSTKIVNTRVTDVKAAPQGIRWIETRPYAVYVFQGHVTNSTSQPIPIYYGVHELQDQVNGISIDNARPMWEVNYSGDFFASETMSVEFDENGNLKSAGVASDAGGSSTPPAASSAAPASSPAPANSSGGTNSSAQPTDK